MKGVVRVMVGREGESFVSVTVVIILWKEMNKSNPLSFSSRRKIQQLDLPKCRVCLDVSIGILINIYLETDAYFRNQFPSSMIFCFVFKMRKQ
jgi:hypothetical protein